MTDTRRVCDLSAGELLEAALEATSGLGWTRSAWVLELHAIDGVVRKLEARPVAERPVAFTLGRHALLDLHRPGT